MASYGFSTMTPEDYAELTDDQIREHYERIRPISRAASVELDKMTTELYIRRQKEKEGKE